jgi:hypothetical protein
MKASEPTNLVKDIDDEMDTAILLTSSSKDPRAVFTEVFSGSRQGVDSCNTESISSR